jgi:serine/threonine protein kinase
MQSAYSRKPSEEIDNSGLFGPKDRSKVAKDEACDIWSIGMILLAMAARGGPNIPSSSESNEVPMILPDNPPEELKRFIVDTHGEECWWLIEDMLTTDPKMRVEFGIPGAPYGLDSALYHPFLGKIYRLDTNRSVAKHVSLGLMRDESWASTKHEIGDAMDAATVRIKAIEKTDYLENTSQLISYLRDQLLGIINRDPDTLIRDRSTLSAGKVTEYQLYIDTTSLLIDGLKIQRNAAIPTDDTLKQAPKLSAVVMCYLAYAVGSYYNYADTDTWLAEELRELTNTPGHVLNSARLVEYLRLTPVKSQVELELGKYVDILMTKNPDLLNTEQRRYDANIFYELFRTKPSYERADDLRMYLASLQEK